MGRTLVLTSRPNNQKRRATLESVDISDFFRIYVTYHDIRTSSIIYRESGRESHRERERGRERERVRESQREREGRTAEPKTSRRQESSHVLIKGEDRSQEGTAAQMIRTEDPKTLNPKP